MSLKAAALSERSVERRVFRKKPTQARARQNGQVLLDAIKKQCRNESHRMNLHVDGKRGYEMVPSPLHVSGRSSQLLENRKSCILQKARRTEEGHQEIQGDCAHVGDVENVARRALAQVWFRKKNPNAGSSPMREELTARDASMCR